MALPVGVTPAIPNDPIFARDRKYAVQRNASIASESGSAVSSSVMMFTTAHNMGGKTPAQAAQGLGGGSYASAQVGYRTV